jgi:type I restriction enzyme M protein
LRRSIGPDQATQARGLQDFIDRYHPAPKKRKETGHFKYFDYKTLIARDKASLDIFWLKDDSLDNLDNLPPPDLLAQELVEHPESALASFREAAASLPRFRDPHD